MECVKEVRESLMRNVRSGIPRSMYYDEKPKLENLTRKILRVRTENLFCIVCLTTKDSNLAYNSGRSHHEENGSPI